MSPQQQPKTAPAVEIQQFKPIKKGGLLASFSVVARGTKVHDCKVCTKDGEWFVVGPQREYQQNGERRFAAVVEFSDEFLKYIVQAVRPHVEGMSGGGSR